MASLQEALVSAKLATREAADEAATLWMLPDQLRPSARRFRELKDRWPKLPGEVKMLLAVDLASAQTVGEKKRAFERANAELEKMID